MIGFFGSRRFSLTLILLAAAALSWWLSHGPEDLLFSPKPLLRHEPDYFLEDFSLTVAGDDGLPRYRMTGVSMTHYPDTDSALLQQPRLEITAAGGKLWIITAGQAQTEKNGEFVHLEEGVSIYRDGDDKASEIGLQTEVLDVYVAEDYAVTDRDVIIRQPYGVTRAQGMRINFPQRQLYLKSRVRGEYALPAG